MTDNPKISLISQLRPLKWSPVGLHPGGFTNTPCLNPRKASPRSRLVWRICLCCMCESGSGTKLLLKAGGKGCEREKFNIKERMPRRKKGANRLKKGREREVDDLDQTFISCQVVLWCFWVEWLNSTRVCVLDILFSVFASRLRSVSVLVVGKSSPSLCV